MDDRIAVYVDGESHYIRSEKAWRKIHGGRASLAHLRFKGRPEEQFYLVDVGAKVFWNPMLSPGAQQTSYFTAISGDVAAVYDTKKRLRDFGLEPEVIHEHKSLADQRANLLAGDGLIEKAKGADIALAVRMVLDAHHSHFDVCHLYTSDADFMPAIKELVSLRKKVCVFGYWDALGKNSDMLVVPTQFVDLTVTLRDKCELVLPALPSSELAGGANV